MKGIFKYTKFLENSHDPLGKSVKETEKMTDSINAGTIDTE